MPPAAPPLEEVELEAVLAVEPAAPDVELVLDVALVLEAALLLLDAPAVPPDVLDVAPVDACVCGLPVASSEHASMVPSKRP